MRAFLLLSSAIAAMASAAHAAAIPSTIVVIGQGDVSTAPQLVTLKVGLRGEGATPDAATSELANARQALEGGMRALGGRFAFTTGEMDFSQAHGPDCEAADNGSGERLSAGACAVVGYVVSTTVTVKTDAVAKAGTLIGLAGRLGARGAEIGEFELLDQAEARSRAAAAAVSDATRRAQAIAQGAKITLGRIQRIEDEQAMAIDASAAAAEITVTAQRATSLRPPVEVSLVPEPIKTTVRLAVTFEAAN